MDRYTVQSINRGERIPSTDREILRFVVPFESPRAAARHAASLFAEGHHVTVRDEKGALVTTGKNAATFLFADTASPPPPYAVSK